MPLLGCGEGARGNGGGNATGGEQRSSVAERRAVQGSNERPGVPACTQGASNTGGASGVEAGSDSTVPAEAGASGTDGSAGDASIEVIVTIKNGDYWKDTAGNRIEAHGAGVIRVGDTWYWIGEDKSANSANFKAVNCYASRDLSNWEFRHAIITRQTSTDLAAADRIIERPKVVYNESTKKYVMWVHWEGKATRRPKRSFHGDCWWDYAQVRHRPNNMSAMTPCSKTTTARRFSRLRTRTPTSLYELTDDYPI
jgi:hypothetical protein